MKKKYEAPVAKKVEFDYKENVVASGAATKENNRCGTCKSDYKPKPQPTKYGPWGMCWYRW